MAFALISADSRGWLATADSAAADLTDADRAASTLRADYERWSRWWLGVGAYVSAVFGWFVGGGMITAMLSPGVRVLPSDIVITAVFWVLAIGGSVVLWMLWRSGRNLVRAAAWWLRAPYVLGHRPRVAAGWVQARTVNTEPPVLARITTATFVFLFGIAGVAWLFRDPTAGLGLVIGVLGLLSLACSVGQMGGVIRLVSGLSEADPLWVRLRSAMRRS